MQPTTKTARLAPYLDAIEQVRKAGWLWEDVRKALAHLEISDNPQRLRQIYQHAQKRREKGALEVDQLPLPDNDENAGAGDKTDKTETDENRTADSQNSQNPQNSEPSSNQQQNDSEGGRKGGRSTQSRGISRPGDKGFKGKT